MCGFDATECRNTLSARFDVLDPVNNDLLGWHVAIGTWHDCWARGKEAPQRGTAFCPRAWPAYALASFPFGTLVTARHGISREGLGEWDSLALIGLH
jgi:hypothetical protein